MTYSASMGESSLNTASSGATMMMCIESERFSLNSSSTSHSMPLRSTPEK